MNNYLFRSAVAVTGCRRHSWRIGAFDVVGVVGAGE